MKKKKSKTQSSNLSRRGFLKTTGFASGASLLGPGQLLLSSLIEGMFQKAHAEENNLSELNYLIQISIAGGLSRWMYDLPLIPNGNDKFIENPMLITKFDNFSKQEVSYATMKRGQNYFPYIWSLYVPSANGTLRPMTDLLDHMITFRGINLLSDGHRLNQDKQNAPIPGQPSINGLLSDHSNMPFPSVYYNHPLNYKSESGVGSINATSSNPIKKILSPFNLDQQKNKKLNNERMIDQALEILKQHEASAGRKSKSIFKDQVSAKNLFKRELGNLDEAYSRLYTKYEKIISNCMGLKYPGISNYEIITKANDSFRMQTNAGTGIYRLQAGLDLRDTIIKDGVSQGSLNQTISGQANTTVINLARVMALTEYVFTQKLTTVVTGVISHLNNLYLPVVDPSNGTNLNLKNKIQNNDQHSSGRYTTMYHNTYYYLALSACQLELFDQLKKVKDTSGKSLFDKTVLHLSGDFNRSPKSSGFGSDHGWQGSNATIFSGMIDKPIIIGNIKADSGKANYKGSWGVAAPNKDLSGREMQIGNVTSSLAKILKIKSPTPNDDALLDLRNGKIISYASKPENI